MLPSALLTIFVLRSEHPRGILKICSKILKLSETALIVLRSEHPTGVFYV